MFPSNESRQAALEAKLQKVNDRLRREMLARGFDPDQEDNVALTSPLAELYNERETLRSELEALRDNEDNEAK